MSAPYQHIKRYQNFFGIDLKSNDLEFPEQYASEVNNIQFTATGTIEKRLGYQGAADTGSAPFGLFTYNRFDTNGNEVNEVLGVSNTIKRLATVSITVTYTPPGTNTTALVQLLYDTVTSQYRCIIQEGTSVVLDQALGVGIDEVSPYTITQLASAIDGLANFSCPSPASGGSTPAAFLAITPTTNIYNNPLTLSARHWETLNVSPQTAKAGPLQGSETNKNSASFENVSSTQLQNCIYFSNGHDPVLKYDGQNVYRAGLPPASDGSTGTFTITATGTAGPSPANNYIWRQQFIQVDNNGNVIEGNTVFSPEYNYEEPSGGTPATVTVTSIQAGSGFNTNCAIITASGTGTAIPVTAGHTMKAGDTAYLWDTVTSSYVTRTVSSVGATTVNVSASVGYSNSATNSRNVISNNLRIRILRNKNTGIRATLWFELIEIPNNSFVATQTFTDTIDDDNLSLQFLEPTTDRSPPVSGKYISGYQNLMVTAGNISNTNEVSFSDVLNPEYFPVPAGQFRVTNIEGDQITAIHPSSESFLIFQSRSIHAVTGDVPNLNFRVDVITQDIGCAAHASIEDVRGTICFLSNVGPRVMVGASIPKGLGQARDNDLNSRIDPLFIQRGVLPSQVYRLKRAIGLNDRKNEKYLIYIPAETETSGVRFPNSNSIVLCYDYTRDSWVNWSGINAHGGMTIYEPTQDLFFAERRTNALTNYVYRRHNSGTRYDYQDHTSAITAFYKSPWEFMGETGTLKNFQRIRVYSAEDTGSDFVLDIKTEKDFISDVTVSNCSLIFGSTGYGLTQYGIDPWGGQSTAGVQHKLSNGKVISFRVIFTNNEDQKNIAITGYELEVNVPYKPGFKK